MDLDKFDAAASRELAWFRERLLKEGAAQLWQSCLKLGGEGIARILVRQHSEIAGFITARASQREKQLRAIADSTERHGFLVAATYTVRCGAAWLDIACRCGVSAGYNPAPAFLLNQAATAAMELEECFPTYWPFEDYPDPFHPPEGDRN